MIKLKDLIEENDANYRGGHTAPDPDAAAPLYDLTLNSIYPKDVYKTLSYYETNGIHDAESISKIWGYHNKPFIWVTVYRAVPKGVSSINNGDWVTISRSYAKEHAHSNFPKKEWKILSKRVRAKDLWNNGDSIHEWGYVPNPDTKLDIDAGKIFSKQEMIGLGADGYLNNATLRRIPIDKIDGREPIPEPDSYKPGKPITQPIEVEYNAETKKYILYSGNHRVRQAEINGNKLIIAFVQYNK